MFYIGKYGKMAKITYIDVLSHPNGVFCANFIPYPKGHNIRDILSQFLNIEIPPSGMGGLKDAKKWSFLTILEAKTAQFQDYEPFNKIFGANFVP